MSRRQTRQVKDFGPEYTLVDFGPECEDLAREYRIRPRTRFGCFFAIVGEGYLRELWGVESNIPRNHYTAYRIV